MLSLIGMRYRLKCAGLDQIPRAGELVGDVVLLPPPVADGSATAHILDLATFGLPLSQVSSPVAVAQGRQPW